MQIRLIYSSTSVSHIDETLVNDILATATAFNAEHNITGMLCYDKKYFFQCLEGEREQVNALYDKIVHDKRHNNLFLLEYTETSNHIFKEWSMAEVNLEEEDVAFVVKTYMKKGFRPQQLNASQATDLIEILGTYLKGKTK